MLSVLQKSLCREEGKGAGGCSGGEGGEEVRGTRGPVYMLEYLVGVVALRE